MQKHLNKEQLMDLYRLFCQYPAVCTDTRSIVRNSLFFALKGRNFDANNFAMDALRGGAAIAVIDDKQLHRNVGSYPMLANRIFLVPDCLTALQDLAKYHRKQLSTKIIAITGTNGKTTTKNLMAAVLSKKFNVVATRGNFNNHIGVPLTLLSMHADTEIGLVEMGASHGGEIRDLCYLAAPDMGLITNVGKAHIEGFGSLEGVMKCKGALYDYLLAYRGVIFYDTDNSLLCDMMHKKGTDAIKPIRRSIKTPAILVPYGAKYQEAVLDPAGAFLRFSLPAFGTVATRMVGNYNLNNVLAALAVGHYLGVPDDEAVRAVSDFLPDELRSRWMETVDNRLIVDAYNANPASMRAALENFAALEVDFPKVLILGDMLELGPDSAKEHKAVVNLSKRLGLEQAFWVGPCFAPFVPKSRSFASAEQLAAWLDLHPLKGACVLLKGSRGMKMETLTAVL